MHTDCPNPIRVGPNTDGPGRTSSRLALERYESAGKRFMIGLADGVAPFKSQVPPNYEPADSLGTDRNLQSGNRYRLTRNSNTKGQTRTIVGPRTINSSFPGIRADILEYNYR